MLKSRSTLPPGGWVYRQAETNWASAFGLTFDETVDAIIAHRRANPRFNLSTDWATVAVELEVYTEKRLLQIPGAKIYLTASDPKPERPSHLAQPVHQGGVAAGAKPSIVAGIPVLINWLGDGLRPVDQALAEGRAAVCAGGNGREKCPQNQAGDWRRWFTEPVAAVLKMQMEIKADKNLSTTNDDKLGVCDACACELHLKVWSPIRHITDNMNEATKARLDPRCWITKEK